MHIFLDILIALKKVCIAFFVSWLQFFIPPARKSVRGEVILVTGAANGMGREIAKQFAKLGGQVVLWDIDYFRLLETSNIIKEEGGKCNLYVCDVSNRASVKETAKLVKAEVGEVTLLINNAGVVAGKKLLDLTNEEIKKTFDVNLFAHFWTTKEFLPSMLENNHGHIVNIASSTGLIGVSQLTDYSTSKFGVVGFTEVLDYELHFSGHDGVHTTVICPSFVKTALFEGCAMPFPSLLPDLELVPTVKRIMDAILTNQKQLYLPRLVYFMVVLKTLIPVSAFKEVLRFFRADQFMSSFKGRRISQIPDVTG